MLKPAALFTDGAVLCRNKEIRVFGETDHRTVTVILLDKTGATLAETVCESRDGRFLAFLDPQQAQTGCRLVIRAGNEQAEAADDEKPVVDYLKAHGLWDQYETEREKLRTYAGNISDIKYLYIVVWGGKDSKYNMYLLDADDVPVYETGYYEEREKEFLGI